MSIITLDSFGGHLPSVPVQRIPPGSAQLAKDCKIEDGNLKPFGPESFVWDPSKAGPIQSLYHFDGAYWFHWPIDVDVVGAPVGGDTLARTIYTGDGTPKITDNTIATTGGGTDYPINAYELGIPAPTNPPSVTVGGASTDPDDAVTTVYVETFLRRWNGIDEEGPPSPASTAQDIEFVNSQTGEISGLNTVPAGAYNITHRRIYRANFGAAATDFQFVTELPIATVTHSDGALSEALGELILTADYDPPPDDLAGVVVVADGILAGFTGKDVCFCEPGQAHAWPVKYRKPCDSPVVALGVANNTVIATTTGIPYLIGGAHPGYMSAQPLDLKQSCVSKRGLVSIGSAVIYPAPDGLVMVGNGAPRLLTKKAYTKKAWKALSPETMTGAYHEGRYYGFYDTGTVKGGIIVDLETGAIVELTRWAGAAFVDEEDDTLYYVNASDLIVKESEVNPADVSYSWKSGRIDAPRPVNPGAAQVLGSGFAAGDTLKLYADGALVHTETLTDEKPFTLPAGYLADSFEIQLEGKAEIETVHIAEAIHELRSVA